MITEACLAWMSLLVITAFKNHFISADKILLDSEAVNKINIGSVIRCYMKIIP